MVETARGMNLLRMMARPEILPTDRPLGMSRKYTPAAQMAVPRVIMKKSRNLLRSSIVTFLLLTYAGSPLG